MTKRTVTTSRDSGLFKRWYWETKDGEMWRRKHGWALTRRGALNAGCRYWEKVDRREARTRKLNQRALRTRTSVEVP